MPPQISPSEAAALLQRHWGLTGTLTELGSFEDQNFAVSPDEDGGEPRYVLKINGAERAVSLRLEHEILDALAGAGLPYDLPLPVATTNGVQLVAHGPDTVRLLRWVPGLPLSEIADLGPERMGQLGELTARTAAAMALLTPHERPRDCKWDPRLAADVVAGVLDDSGPARPDEEQAEALRRALEPLADLDGADLPRQLVHCDVTDVNAITRDGVVSGLIDFGDVTDTWRVCDLAVTCHAVVARHAGDALQAILDVVGGYHDVVPLTEGEADALWSLILARAATCAALSLRHARLHPESVYLADSLRNDWLAIAELLALAPGLPRATIRVRAGLPPLSRDPFEPLLAAATAAPYPIVAGLQPRPVDLGVGSDVLRDGAWTRPRRVAEAVARHRATIGRWGEVRLTAAGAPAEVAPATLHLGADLFAPAGEPVRAPVSGRTAMRGDTEMTIELDGGGYLRLYGIEAMIEPGVLVPAGTPVGHVGERADGGPTRVHVQLATDPGQPGLGDPRRAVEWRALCPDPSPLIGLDVAVPPPADPAHERVRRSTVVAGAQRLYYDEPMEMVRGWRQHLYDSHGRPYLDMVNNVAAVGHSHPGVAAAAARQLRLLNTNSRFLYEPMVAYAQRLVDLLPKALDRVFLVNSGSEACDLALQLARVATGRRDVVALQGAYHGWTGAIFELCTAPGDNPRWRETVPAHVHVAEQPNPYRGAHGDDAAAYVRSVAQACAAAPVGAFISEPLLGNQGAVEPPAGYLQQAYAAVRAKGGLCIADEIQVGLARTGETFWAFEHEGVVPDIVTIAKAAGNGHPVGAVVCRHEIADALGERASFFSSPGGGPVSCQVGIAVLDAIGSERLQENAAIVGAQLTRELRALMDRHPAIGAVHGRGLYQGVDLVTDRDSKDPDPRLARAVCERLRRLGVIDQPTGDASNVLKVKPPMCLTAEDARLFVTALDRALTEIA